MVDVYIGRLSREQAPTLARLIETAPLVERPFLSPLRVQIVFSSPSYLIVRCEHQDVEKELLIGALARLTSRVTERVSIWAPATTASPVPPLTTEVSR